MTKVEVIYEIMKIHGEVAKVKEMMESYTYNTLEDWTQIPNKKDLITRMADGMSKTMFRRLGILDNNKCKEMIIKLISDGICGWLDIEYVIEDLEKLGVEFKED